MRPLFRLTILCIGSTTFLASPVASAQQRAATLVASGNLVAPRFSSDGTRLLITGERMHGIGEVTIKTGDVRWHIDEARVGVTSSYLPDGAIGFRAKRAGRLRSLRIGKRGLVTEIQAPTPKVFSQSDTIYLRTTDTVAQVSRGDRFFAPVLSPDASKIAFTGLTTGVHVYDIATKTQIFVGIGTAPSWSPDSKSLAFERTEDDGHNIVGSDLWIWREGETAQVLAKTPSLLERRPSWSPEGTTIAFDDDHGSIYITNVAQKQSTSEGAP